ncbi:MAG: hypothetical protein WD029_02435 [Microthrixaceae bacterium]
MSAPVEDQPLQANSYAVSYRLLGDAVSASAVSEVAVRRVRQLPAELADQWLEQLILFTVQQALQPTTLPVQSEVPAGSTLAEKTKSDVNASLREALRRRLDRATPEEQIAAGLIQLCAYPADFVAELMGISSEAALALAAVIAPPPGVSYRDLGDPARTGSSRPAAPSRFRRKPHWTTFIALHLVVIAVLYATQVTGPRPSLTNEGGLGLRVIPVTEVNSGYPNQPDTLITLTQN